ncbi:hypothetical protein F5144DRAFT_395200 [Chaetomium tenue]|uniref:Uncharacterized protein n=1 Tax=Chaetomium tenue TaxID=1854479 RepID=A0ACB7NW79_9PEZI|nr:hypothetical protein F5144DRAFT_395200 [Chaetomium globosum]
MRESHRAKGWQERSSEVIKQLYYNWRSRTAELLQLATGHQDRLDREYVVGVIREELGAFFQQPSGGGEQARGTGAMDKALDEALAKVADRAVLMDRFVELSPWKWEFYFSDPDTGEKFGFKHDGPTTYHPRLAATRPMDVHVEMSGDRALAVGRPVDHISRPMLRCYRLSRDTFAFERFRMYPLIVAVDIYGGDSGGDEEGNDDGDSGGGEGEESKCKECGDHEQGEAGMDECDKEAST